MVYRFFAHIVRLILPILLTGMCSLHGTSQELSFSNLGNGVQLPSQECYKILQDRQGYIWFSTDNGLCRYANNQLIVFNEKNGLPEKNVYCIVEDPKGKLWFATSENRILYFDNDQKKLREASFSKAYKKLAIPPWVNGIPYFMDMSDPGNIQISNSYYAARIDARKNKVTRIAQSGYSELSATFVKEKGKPFFPTCYNFVGDKSRIVIKNEKQSKVIFFPSFANNFTHWISCSAIVKEKKKDFISVHNKLVRIDQDFNHSVYNFPDRILNLYIDKTQGLWVAVKNNGVFYYPDVNTMDLAHQSLREYSVTGICEDYERGVWCSTLEKGIFYCKNKYLTGYNSVPGLDKRTTLLSNKEGYIYAASSGEQLFRLDGKSLKTFPISFNSEPVGLMRYKKGWVIFGKENTIRTDNQFRKILRLVQIDSDFAGSYQMINTPKGELLSIMYHCLFFVDDSRIINRIRCGLTFTSKCVLIKDENTVFLGGKHGMYVYDLHTGKYRRIDGSPRNITRLAQSRSGRIWIATKEAGIFWMDHEKIFNANKELQISTPLFQDITEDIHGTVWAASSDGLYRFIPRGTRYATELFNVSRGLSSNDVSKITTDSTAIWFTTYEGLFKLPLEVQANNDTPPIIHLQAFSVNDREIKHPKQFIKTPYEQNNLYFAFNILTFKHGSNTRIEYRLTHDGETNVTKVNGNEVILTNLSPGSYTLKVYGINNDGIKSMDPQVFRIEITPPFWQTWWFISLLALLVSFTILIIVRLIIHRIREGEKAKTLVNKLMAEYQITALQAQMNPHFIFNAINTIQGYILEKKENDAYGYLAKFSKLIRMVLNNSQEKMLPLEQELEVLDLYIELEQLRFDHCFEYHLDIDKTVDINDIYIPGMLIQPYVENAIWHGIINLKNSRKGHLRVGIELQGDMLKISISDNGVGRKKALSFQKDLRHRSVGMKLTEQRLQVINQLYGNQEASVLITDLADENNKAAGTKVEITIPATPED